MIELKTKITSNADVGGGAVDILTEAVPGQVVTRDELQWAALITNVIVVLSKSKGGLKSIFHQKVAAEIELRANASMKIAIKALDEAAKKATKM